MTDLILRQFHGKEIRHRESDGWLSLTDMVDCFPGMLIADWLRLKSTKRYLSALESNMGNPILERKVGGTHDGTWADRRVAVRLAQWLDPYFAIQVDEWVIELLTKGSITLTPVTPETPKDYIQTVFDDLLVQMHKNITRPSAVANYANAIETLRKSMSFNVPEAQPTTVNHQQQTITPAKKSSRIDDHAIANKVHDLLAKHIRTALRQSKPIHKSAVLRHDLYGTKTVAYKNEINYVFHVWIDKLANAGIVSVLKPGRSWSANGDVKIAMNQLTQILSEETTHA